MWTQLTTRQDSLSCLDPISNFQLFCLKYIEEYWKLRNWKLGRDETKLIKTGSRQDKTVLSCMQLCSHCRRKTRQASLVLRRRCEQVITEIFIRRSWYSVLPRLDATIDYRVKKAVMGMTELITALSQFMACWPSFLMCTASLIYLVGWSDSPSITTAFVQWISWVAWSTVNRHVKSRKDWVPASSDKDLCWRSKCQSKCFSLSFD